MHNVGLGGAKETDLENAWFLLVTCARIAPPGKV